MKTSTLLACSLFLPAVALAEDYTVDAKPFFTDTTVNAVFLPVRSQPVSVHPKYWSDFKITTLVPHGSHVKKGQVLIGIDTEKIDKRIAELETSQKTGKLNLEKAKHELEQMKITTPRKLADAARKEKETKENFVWYKEIGMPVEITNVKDAVKGAEQKLSYLQEELKQLELMYKEDGKVEQTEEIILIRTRNSIEHAQNGLKALKVNAEKSLKTSIPRKLLGYELAYQNAKIANASAKVELPRALKLKELSVAKAIRDNAKSVKELEGLKKDREMMRITASSDGVVYYGNIKNGRWTPSSLKVSGKLATNSDVMTLIPVGTPLELSAFAEEAKIATLLPTFKGYASATFQPRKNFSVQVASLSEFPEADGKFHVVLKPTLPKDLKVVPGMKATAHLISNRMDSVLKVPSSYLKTDNDGGFSVKVKTADGKSVSRKVTIGASDKNWVVITKGLEKGQVIVK